MNCTGEQDQVCCYQGCALGVPGCCPSSGWDGAAGGGWDPLLTSAATARDLQGIVIPDKNQGTDTVTVTKRRAGASSEPKYLPVLFAAVPQNHPRFQHLVSCFLQHLGSPCHKDCLTSLTCKIWSDLCNLFPSWHCLCSFFNFPSPS